MRRKSYAEIARQRNRISKEIFDRANAANRLNSFGEFTDSKDIARYRKVRSISKRYMDNIFYSKSYQRSFRSDDDTAANNRKYSQSIYMGLSNG